MTRSNPGFTLIEVLVAIALLSLGIAALAGASGLVTRMIGRGKVETRAAQVAAVRIESLRLAAHETSPRCTAPGFASGGPVLSSGMTESWVVPAAGRVRRVRVEVTYLTVQGPRTAVLETAMEC